MKHIAQGVVLLAASATTASALGLDRSAQDITAIFEPGGYAELSYGFTQPDLTGTDVLGNPIGNVGGDYGQTALAFKMDFGPGFSFGLILDQPYGSDIEYGGDPDATPLGGTAATLDSRAITAIGRYRFNDNFSVHAGVRQVMLDGETTLKGQAFGPLNGYNVKLENGEGAGWLAGVAYERPEIALRVALTYNSEIVNSFDTIEATPGGPFESTTEVSAPEAWNLDFQTGVAQDTLVYGTIRYAAYSQTILSPELFSLAMGGTSIVDLNDGTSYTLGVARSLTDSFAGLASITYEPENSDALFSPLSPTNGLVGITVGGLYTLNAVEIRAGIRYTMTGDADIGVGGAQVATFTDTDALSLGVSVGYRF